MGSRRPSWAQGRHPRSSHIVASLQGRSPHPPRASLPFPTGVRSTEMFGPGCSLSRLSVRLLRDSAWFQQTPGQDDGESEEPRHSAGGCLVCRGGRVTSAQTPRWRWTAHVGRCPLKTIPDKCHCADGRHFVFFKKNLKNFYCN